MSNKEPTTPTTPTEIGGKAIPMPWPSNTAGSKYHWWYDSKSAGVANSPPPTMTGHSPPSNYSVLSQSPPAGGDFLGPNAERRGSLKNMIHLCDFATP